jgi:hypothetical protein
MLIDLTTLSRGTTTRLERIKKLKKCDDKTALEFAISAGWLAAESLDTSKRLEKVKDAVYAFHISGECGLGCVYCAED